MKLHHYTECPSCVILFTDAGTSLRVEAWSGRILRLTYSEGEPTEGTPTGDIITATPRAGSSLTVTQTDAEVTLSAGETSLVVRRATFGLRFLRGTEQVLKLAPMGMQVHRTVITKPVYVTDPEDMTKLKLLRVEERPGYRFWLSFDFAARERIYGLGQGVTGEPDRRRVSSYLYQQNNTAPTPVFISSRGYGVFVNTEAFCGFSRDEFGTTFHTDPVEAADWFFFGTSCADEAIADYRFLTGQVPMMPKWLFGYLQSKERYCTQDETVGIVKEYRRRHVPLDMILQDWNYWVPGTWSEKAFDPSRYPDPSGMCDEIHGMHAHVMISVWPNTSGGECYRELAENNMLLAVNDTYGGGGTLNVFDPAARDTYWKQLSRGIFRHGFDAWWVDASEPFEAAYGAYNEASEAKTAALTLYRKWMDASRINAYPLLHLKGVYENQRKETSAKRVVGMTRSSYAGQQRYGSIIWSGDTGSSYSELRRQIAEGLSYCASGLPYWNSDIGGFFPVWGGGKHMSHVPYHANTEPGYRELYTRWLQFGCFLPVMRSHGTCFGREIWQFGEEGGMFYESIRKFIELRYRLMPYIYSTAWQVSKNAETFIRLLAFDFANDPEALEQGSDSYMFGRALLVSPVTTPMYYEDTDTPLSDVPKTKTVYLPAGTAWYDYWSEKRYDGGQYVTVDAPIDSMPLFVRAGSVIPTSPVMQYADEIRDAPYLITVYPGDDGRFTLYEDEGDNYNYESGAYAEVDFDWNDADSTLTVSDRRGCFDGMCQNRGLEIRIVGMGHTDITYGGHAVKVKMPAQ